MNYPSTSPSSGYNGPPPHYLNRNDPERRPRPVDPSGSPGYPPQNRPPYPKRPMSEDGLGDLGAFIGFQASAPVYVSARTRKRVSRLQVLAVLGVFALLGLWFYSRYRTMLLEADIPVYPGDIPQEFRLNPTRYVQSRHSTTLRSDLPHYSFTSLSGWANGTFEILAAEKGEDQIKFEVLVESPTIQTSNLFTYDDSKAHDKGAIVMKLTGRVSPPIMSKWIKLHARLILPTHRTYPSLKVQLFPALPHWQKISMDAIDVASGIIFKTLDLTTKHGDIEVRSLSASKSIIETSRGDIRHGRLNVSPENLLVSTGKGSVIPI